MSTPRYTQGDLLNRDWSSFAYISAVSGCLDIVEGAGVDSAFYEDDHMVLDFDGGEHILVSYDRIKYVEYSDGNDGPIDSVNHPTHYTSHPSGVECIQVTEHMGFNLGNAMKYVWRADLKANAEEDLRKAIWYIERELKKRSDTNGN